MTDTFTKGFEDNALKDSEKLESQLDKDLKNELGEDQPSKSETPNEIKDANKQDTSKLKEPGQDPVEMNKGGEVPGSGNTDTVPAMLTPGEFVMTKEAVQKYGLDTLEGLNAAAGGTNKPTLKGGYNEGGQAIDKSHYGTTGYRIGQVMPDQYVYDFSKYTSSYKTKGGEV